MLKYYTVFDGRPNIGLQGADLRVGISMASSWYQPDMQKQDEATPEEEKIEEASQKENEIEPTSVSIHHKPENNISYENPINYQPDSNGPS